MKVLTVINFAETKRRFDESGRSVGKFSKVHGFNTGTFTMFLKGALPYKQGVVYEAMVKALKDADCLVEDAAEDTAA